MRVLALTHQDNAPPGGFGDVARARGHALEVRSFAQGDPPAAGGHDAVMVFGGSAQLDQPHGWLAGERAFAGDLLDRGVPVLGVCLGGQLLAQAAGADVGPARVPEVGWHQVELTPDARDDPLLAGLPRRFEAFQWHSYGFGLPDDAFALAYGPGDALQACRVGESAWAIQFHAEVTHAILDGWIEEDGGRELGDPGALLARSQTSMPRWNELGRALCGRFLEFAEGAGR